MYLTSVWETDFWSIVCFILEYHGKWFEPRSISCLSCVIVWVRVVFRKAVGKWFEPRSISCLSCVIAWVRVVLRKTVAGHYQQSPPTFFPKTTLTGMITQEKRT